MTDYLEQIGKPSSVVIDKKCYDNLLARSDSTGGC